MLTKKFNYEEAFSRSIGWLTECELQQLRLKKVAIAGCGGVGGFHLLTLTRLGIGNFHLADFDEFDICNFNRQIGATLQTVHQPKTAVLDGMAKSINPELNTTLFREGVTDENIDDFLKDVDLYIDGLDFFALNIRQKVFKRCYELNIPAITAGPIGMGTAYLIFMPDQMSFETYFRLTGLSDIEAQINFLIGLAPKPLALKYLVDPLATNFEEKKGPSTVMACELAAGVLGTEALKILLKRGPIYPAPHYHFFDAYLRKYQRGWIPWGNQNPVQLIKRAIVKKLLLKPKPGRPAVFSQSKPQSDLEKIVDIARWAPSGDNKQPWRFQFVNQEQVLVRLTDDAKNNPYDFAGIPTLLSGGMLLENMQIAATHFGYELTWKYEKKKEEEHEHWLNIRLLPNKTIPSDTLYAFIPYRSVNRNSFQLTSLTQQQKDLLQMAVGETFTLHWFESFDERWKMAKINAQTTHIRLSTPELYNIHKTIIDYQHQYSETAIPINATGLHFITKKLIRFALKKYSRLRFMNRFLGASHITGLELDLIPGLRCSAHFILLPKEEQDNEKPEKILCAGKAMQRFWLMATQLGLVVQPSLAPLCFAYYIKHDISFTKNEKLIKSAKKLTHKLNELSQGKPILFNGRIGFPLSPMVTSRSVRLPLEKLCLK